MSTGERKGKQKPFKHPTGSAPHPIHSSYNPTGQAHGETHKLAQFYCIDKDYKSHDAATQTLEEGAQSGCTATSSPGAPGSSRQRRALPQTAHVPPIDPKPCFFLRAESKAPLCQSLQQESELRILIETKCPEIKAPRARRMRVRNLTGTSVLRSLHLHPETRETLGQLSVRAWGSNLRLPLNLFLYGE